MKKTVAERETTPWYRIGMVWLVIALPLTAVIASLITVKIAHQNAPILIAVPAQK